MVAQALDGSTLPVPNTAKLRSRGKPMTQDAQNEAREGAWFVSIAFMLSGLVIGLAIAALVV
jgi:hypothetical protein